MPNFKINSRNVEKVPVSSLTQGTAFSYGNGHFIKGQESGTNRNYYWCYCVEISEMSSFIGSCLVTPCQKVYVEVTE